MDTITIPGIGRVFVQTREVFVELELGESYDGRPVNRKLKRVSSDAKHFEEATRNGERWRLVTIAHDVFMVYDMWDGRPYSLVA